MAVKAKPSKCFNKLHRRSRLGAGALILLVGSPTAPAIAASASLEESRIFIEYNSTDNDLGFHVFLDGEDWNTLRIFAPNGNVIFNVEGHSGYGEFGLTELFTEGAEPSLFEVPLAELLAFFPEGVYRFEGTLAEGGTITGDGRLSHAVPAGPDVSCTQDVSGGQLRICWDPVAGRAEDPAGGVFPNRRIRVVEYQVIVGSFQVTVPASDGRMRVTVPPEFVASLESGEHGFEVLAIDRSGNQTISAGSFVK
jgi:hypothetical protein